MARKISLDLWDALAEWGDWLEDVPSSDRPGLKDHTMVRKRPDDAIDVSLAPLVEDGLIRCDAARARGGAKERIHSLYGFRIKHAVRPVLLEAGDGERLYDPMFQGKASDDLPNMPDSRLDALLQELVSDKAWGADAAWEHLSKQFEKERRIARHRVRKWFDAHPEHHLESGEHATSSPKNDGD